MNINGWKYYNHAVIPDTPPHITPDTKPIEDGSIWKMKEKPLLARWETDFDCGYETNWWYVIKNKPFVLEEISSKERKSIRQALRKCYVKKIQPSEYVEQLYNCYLAAASKYENLGTVQTKEQFYFACEKGLTDYWGGFDAETGMLIGYMTVYDRETFAEIATAKFNPSYFGKQVSDALYYYILDYYLNECGKDYICSGSRNINHKTNTQEYKIRRFRYRKAYCKLHIVYNPRIRWIIKILYVFRKILFKMDFITFIHQINAVLQMEEIVRKDNE